MTPALEKELREKIDAKLKHATACEAKAREYQDAARKMLEVAAEARALAKEIGSLRASPIDAGLEAAGVDAAARPAGARKEVTQPVEETHLR